MRPPQDSPRDSSLGLDDDLEDPRDHDGAADSRFAEHLANAGGLVAGQRYDEAEAEVMRALVEVPGDLRALNLLALVRFKLGRLDDARAAYRAIATAAPHDAAVRRNLGLLALKAERIDEAIDELELAAHLAPEDQRSWSYLGFAYTRRGDAASAAAAFRRAGQDAVADELEAASPLSVADAPLPAGLASAVPMTSPLPASPALSASSPAPPSPSPSTSASPIRSSPAASPSPVAEASRAPATAFAATASPSAVISSFQDAIERRSSETRAVPMVSFVMSSLGLAGGAGAGAFVKGGAPVRLSARDGAHVRADAVLASVGAAPGERAVRRVRGRASGEWLGSTMRPFFRVTGGDVWVAGTSNRWAALTLDEDTLYVREDRVLAFDGSVFWEAGRIPGDGLRMLQFRGRGQVVLQLAGMPAAIRISDEAPARVARGALLGWVGRVVAHRSRREGPLQISCEGDGVMLLETRRSAS